MNCELDSLLLVVWWILFSSDVTVYDWLGITHYLSVLLMSIILVMPGVILSCEAGAEWAYNKQLQNRNQNSGQQCYKTGSVLTLIFTLFEPTKCSTNWDLSEQMAWYFWWLFTQLLAIFKHRQFHVQQKIHLSIKTTIWRSSSHKTLKIILNMQKLFAFVCVSVCDGAGGIGWVEVGGGGQWGNPLTSILRPPPPSPSLVAVSRTCLTGMPFNWNIVSVERHPSRMSS